MGVIPKVAKFLGVDKFGKGIAAATRTLTGEVRQDIETQQTADASVQKLLYAAKREQDPNKKKRLLEVANRLGGSVQATDIDPNLNLTNKEVLGSAANVVLNVATPGAFKGGKAAVVSKNAALGGAYGAAQGLEKNRDAPGVAGSVVGGAAVGAAVGGGGLLASAAKEFVGKKIPVWMMNKAVKPALQDLKKNVKYGSKTLGEELLDEGVKGGPKRLLEIADAKSNELESQLQEIINHPGLAEARIRRDSVFPYLRETIAQKMKLPGGRNDIIRIKEIYNDIPKEMTLAEANEIKRAIYQELRDPAYKIDASLNTKSQTLKMIARGLKTRIEDEVGGTVVQDINHKLSIYGRLENAMVDQLARNMRNNGIGLTDAILAAGGPTTSLLALLRHVGQGVETHTAQELSQVQKIGTGPVGETVKGAVKRAVLNAP
jgi:hypothetical protein